MEPDRTIPGLGPYKTTAEYPPEWRADEETKLDCPCEDIKFDPANPPPRPERTSSVLSGWEWLLYGGSKKKMQEAMRATKMAAEQLAACPDQNLLFPPVRKNPEGTDQAVNYPPSFFALPTPDPPSDIQDDVSMACMPDRREDASANDKNPNEEGIPTSQDMNVSDETTERTCNTDSSSALHGPPKKQEELYCGVLPMWIARLYQPNPEDETRSQSEKTPGAPAVSDEEQKSSHDQPSKHEYYRYFGRVKQDEMTPVEYMRRHMSKYASSKAKTPDPEKFPSAPLDLSCPKNGTALTNRGR